MGETQQSLEMLGFTQPTQFKVFGTIFVTHDIQKAFILVSRIGLQLFSGK
ncbi:hypothetical protein [Nostoc sp.]